MSLRISSALIALILAACGQSPTVVEGETIACSLDGAPDFARSCSAARVGDAIVVRRPDGGFRRIVRTAAGPATDGADEVEQADDGTLAIGADRYRLPPGK